MKTLKRNQNDDGTFEVFEYEHLIILQDGRNFLVRDADANPADLDDNYDCCTSLKAAEKSRENMSWVETSEENRVACQ
jgi:hypothetical protein